MKKTVSILLFSAVLSIAAASAYAGPSLTGKVGGVVCNAITDGSELTSGSYRGVHKNVCESKIDRMSVYGSLLKDGQLVDSTNTGGTNTSNVTGYTYWENESGEWFFDLVAETSHTFSHKGETWVDLETDYTLE